MGIEKEKRDKQTYFHFLDPHLENVLARGDRPQPAFAVSEFRRFEGAPRVRTNISKMERWLPYFYWKEGLADEPMVRDFGEKAEIASIIGSELHGADVLFNLITQGAVGPGVKNGLPSAGQEELDTYYLATEKIEIGNDIDEEVLLNIMVESWKIYLVEKQKQEETNAATLPMFQDMGFNNPLLRESVLKSDELFNKGLLLAKHWAERYFLKNDDEWGYDFNHQSVNEVLTIVNTELLQIVGRLDRVTRQEKTKKTVTVQVTDFKTGRREVEGEMEKEIKKRQAQLALFMAERFTARYVVDKKWLHHSSNGFALNTSVLNTAAAGRARFFYRWFDKGNVDWEEVTMNLEEREEFVEWLIWYSTKAHEYRDELKKLK